MRRLAFVMLALAACPKPTPPPPTVPPPPVAVVDAGAVEVLATAWAQRWDRAALDAALAVPQGAGFDVLLLQARLHLFRAKAFRLHVRPLDREGGLADLDAARVLAAQAWEVLQPGVGALLSQKQGEAAAAAAPATALAALVVRADADLARSRVSSAIEGAHLLREQLALATRAVQLDASYDHAAPLRLMGVALSVLPGPAGGDFLAGRLALEQGVARFPRDIELRVALAEHWAAKAQDKAMFRALLKSALAQDPDAEPDRIPEAHLARAHALGLQRHVRAFFR